MAKETSFYIMPYIRIYKIQDEKTLFTINQRVELAFQAPLSESDKYMAVKKIVETTLFDDVFGINE